MKYKVKRKSKRDQFQQRKEHYAKSFTIRKGKQGQRGGEYYPTSEGKTPLQGGQLSLRGGQGKG